MKKQQSTTTKVNFILDESGSMEMVRDATISGFNEYINSLKKKTKGEILFNLVTFNTESTQVYENEPLKKVKLTKENYQPDGMTALYDAVVNTIEKVAKHDDEKTANLVVIMTDGEENSSREHNQACVRDLVSKLEKRGNWTFVFLGANQDSWATTASLGLAAGNTINWDNSNVKGVMVSFRGLAGSTVAYCASAGTGNLSTSNFFKAERI